MSRVEVDNIFKAYCASSQIDIDWVGEEQEVFAHAMRTFNCYKFTSELGDTSSIGFKPTDVNFDGVFMYRGVPQSIEIVFRNHFIGETMSIGFTSLGDFESRLPNFLKCKIPKKPDVKLPEISHNRVPWP
jgi:hypothetical protein